MELSELARTDRGTRQLNAALKIYKDTILVEAQNPTNQILYWIEHSKDELTDQFRCFAITQKGNVVGYLQYSYFAEEHIFFFEYLCIGKGARGGLAPSAALQCIEEYLVDNYRTNFTIVFEIARKISKDDSEWKTDHKLIQYFSRLGFRTVDFDYRYPILQSFEGKNNSYPADLMVLLPENRKEISASEMRTILRCLYFKHYLRWDRPFLSTEAFVRRERLIDELYTREVARISDNDQFGTRGGNRKTILDRFAARAPNIKSIIDRIFSPKMPRLIFIMFILVIVQWLIGSTLYLVPFVLAAAALYCLAEDTRSSRKLFLVVISRLSPSSRGP